ncbi:MAG: hypothetical protein ACPH19_02200, partial [Flavobacteriaceae bacterium]
MKNLLLLALFSIIFQLSAQQEKIHFDGIVTAEEWTGTQSFTLDYEVNPGDNVAPPYTTQVYVSHSKTDLYVGFIAKADMENLRSSIRNRDEGFRDDHVLIGFDTYGDGRYMITLGANPEGNQIDIKIMPNGSEENYDISYESKASKHQDSYHVELKIPFSNLQFNTADDMRWKVVFARNTFTDSYKSQSINFPIDRNNPCIVCQSPDVINIKGIEVKNRINLLPYIFGGITGERTENTKLSYGQGQANVGISGLMDLNNVTSLEFAINPDFSQVEADVAQVNANNTFALYFREQRPYFNEGNEIIGSELNTVYTRAINDPLGSTKLIHQGENQRLYWLTAWDQNAPYLIAGENGSYSGEGEQAFSNILSYQRTFDQGSYLGLMTTNRVFNSKGSGHTLGINGLLRLGKKYTLTFEYNGSQIKEPIQDWIDSSDVIRGKTVRLDGEKKTGNAGLVSIERNTRNWTTELNYLQYSPHYETPLGFVRQNSIRNMELIQSYTHYPENKEGVIQQMQVNFGSELTFNYNNIRKYFDLFTNIQIQWKGNFRSNFNFVRIINEEFSGFNGTGLTELSTWNNYSPNEAIRIGVFVSTGKKIRYDEDDPSLGKRFFIGTFDSFQVNPKLLLSTSLRYSQMRSIATNELYFKGYIARLNINYQFTQDLSFRLIG